MLGFYKDSSALRPAFGDNPKFFLLPCSGGSFASSLWIADYYHCYLTSYAEPSQSSINVDQTIECAPSGTFTLGTETITYTHKTDTQLYGIPVSGAGSISQTHPSGQSLFPINPTSLNLVVRVSGSDVQGQNPNVKVSFKLPGDSNFGIPNVPLIVGSQSYGPGVTPVQINIQVIVAAGDQEDFQEITVHAPGVSSGTLRVFRANQFLQASARCLAPGRQLSPSLTGFSFGSYRWRGPDNVNSHAVVPTAWTVDPVAVGAEKFIPGIGNGSDLELIDIEKQDTSVLPRINKGFYYTGNLGYYLHSGDNSLVFCAAGPDTQLAPLPFLLFEARPKNLTPIFVGRWRLDQHGYYEKDVSYRYIAPINGQIPDTTSSEYQYALQRTLNGDNSRSWSLSINKTLPIQQVFIGVAPNTPTMSVYLPFHPTHMVTQVWADSPYQQLFNFSFDPNTSILSIALPPTVLTITINPISGLPNAAAPLAIDWTGRAIYAECVPGLAVLYETDIAGSPTRDTRLLPLDLNPAFAGISSGYINLQQRRWIPQNIQLYCDKNRITVPNSFAGQPNLVGFGPVYYEGDYALILAKATGSDDTDLVPDVTLRVVPTPGQFQGTINNIDPTSTQLTVTTGGDGVASLIYQPPASFGYWVYPIDASILPLPIPIPISQLWNSIDGWLVTTYQVMNNDPYLGKLFPNTALGEVQFASSGSPGTVSFKTNGRRLLMKKSGGSLVLPTDALDSNGRSHTDSLFNGFAVSLSYTGSVALSPPAANVSLYFIGIQGVVSFSVMDDRDGVESNTILLTLSAPVEIIDWTPDAKPIIPATSGYLIFDDQVSGRLSVNRLAGAALPPITFEVPRI